MNALGKALSFLGLVMLLASVLEALVLRFIAKRSYNWRGSLASLSLLIIGRITGQLIPVAVAMPGAYWLYQHRLLVPESLGAWSYVLLFLGIEFTYYWWHRLSHRCRWFWLHHAVHHSPNEFNLTAVYRLGLTGKLMAGFFMFIPLAALGFEPELIFVAYYLNLAYQFWIHAEWIPQLGPLEGILNTPAAHRVHHASNLDYLDANYGGVLMVFDRLFGTYRPERTDVVIQYGLVHPLKSNNPLKIAFHQFGTLFKDLRNARSFREVLGYLFAPPGWKPDGKGETTEELRSRVSTVQQPAAV